MKMRKILTCLLAITASVSAVGCNIGGNGLAGVPKPTSPQEDFQAHYVEGMLHEVDVDYNNPANRSFITNGKSDYKIVLGSAEANEAVAYVNKHFGAGADCMLERLDLFTEAAQESLDVSENSSYVFFGCNYLFENAGFLMPAFEEIGSTGYYIVTYGKNVFVQAYGTQGYQLGGLCLLRQTLGFDVISTTTTIYEKDGSVLPRMEIKERPDFDYRQADCMT